MRTRDMLNSFDEISILYKYLYSDKENRIIVNNGMTNLEIRLDENLDFYCKNLSFPDVKEMFYNENMTLKNSLGIIDYLKGQQAKKFPDSFSNEWEELKGITCTTLALNFFNKRR